ncbi:ATP-binding protein [Kitasatospora camelliae]|uniref:ATP-binding protein n=1 Tax=Kitasatospora camelliae TaxID=3156397 RepID=A0AAU8K8D0_9ACTN
MRQVPALELELDGRPGSVHAARSATLRFLHEVASHDRAPLSAATRQDAVLVVSELVCNACRHAPGPCWLSVVVTPEATVDIAVEDTSPHLPRPTGRPGPAGYGLVVVTALGRGFHVVPTGTGKIVATTLHDR